MLKRYLAAFWTALKLTLRGEQPPPLPHTAHREWARQAAELVELVSAAVAQYGTNPGALTLRIEGRSITMETILATIHFHVTEEYIYLLGDPGAQSLTAIYASNFNDHFMLTRLLKAESLAGTPIQAAIARLAEHLEAIPGDPWAGAAR